MIRALVAVGAIIHYFYSFAGMQTAGKIGTVGLGAGVSRTSGKGPGSLLLLGAFLVLSSKPWEDRRNDARSYIAAISREVIGWGLMGMDFFWLWIVGNS